LAAASNIKGTGLELACWLVAAILALALALGPAANGGTPAQATTVTAPTPALHLYRQYCIERILTHVTGKTEEEVVKQINLQCRTAAASQPSPAAGLRPLTCARRLTAPFAPVATRVAGCVGP
jgi:hypothetical protein